MSFLRLPPGQKSSNSTHSGFKIVILVIFYISFSTNPMKRPRETTNWSSKVWSAYFSVGQISTKNASISRTVTRGDKTLPRFKGAAYHYVKDVYLSHQACLVVPLFNSRGDSKSLWSPTGDGEKEKKCSRTNKRFGISFHLLASEGMNFDAGQHEQV